MSSPTLETLHGHQRQTTVVALRSLFALGEDATA